MTVSAIRSRLTDLVRQWTPVPPPSPEGAGGGDAEVADARLDGPVDESSAASAEPSAGIPGADRPTSAWARFAPRELSRPQVRALGVGLAALLVVVGWWWWQGRPHPVTAAPELVAAGAPAAGSALNGAAASPAGVEAAMVIVQVAGPVRRPGIVTVPGGSRVIDAIKAAGGLRRGADYGTVNLARPVIDGEQIVVGADAAAGTAGGPSAPLSLNQATAADLEDLPGVGPVLAARIIDWRERNGGFHSLDELREVSGIGDATFTDLAPLLTAP